MIIIDPGHGGTDSGGGSNQYFKEKDLNLKISIYQAQRLNELGIKALLTRETDITMYPAQRIEKIKSLSSDKTDILISNHINYGDDHGGEVIYSFRGTKSLPNLIATYLSKANLNIRNVYQRANYLGLDYYFILRETVFNNALIIEYGFANDDNDTYRLRFEWINLAEAVIHALCDYYNVNYQIYTPYYIVKENDSLYSIAKKYNTDVTTLKTLNNLTNNEIYPEEIIITK